MHIVRRAFRRKLAAIVVLQAAHRGRMTRRQVGTLRRHVAATRIQSAYRMHQARMILNAHRQLMCAMKLQVSYPSPTYSHACALLIGLMLLQVSFGIRARKLTSLCCAVGAVLGENGYRPAAIRPGN
jgi:hypothetical protein